MFAMFTLSTLAAASQLLVESGGSSQLAMGTSLTHTADGSCDGEAIANCAQLFGEHITEEKLAEALGLDAAEVTGLLRTLYLDGSAFHCEMLCEKATVQTDLIGVQTIPTKPGHACLDCACTDLVPVDETALAEVANDLLANRPAQDEAGNVLTPKPVMLEPDPTGLKEEKDEAEVLRSVLTVVFGLFPPTSQACDADDAAAVFDRAAEADADGLVAVRRELAPALGRQMERAHGNKLKKIRQGCQLSTAWAASALRNMNTRTGKSLRRTWFGRKGESENQSHLKRVLNGILTVMDNVLVKSGSHGGNPRDPSGRNICSVSSGSGTMAYVYPEQKERKAGGNRYIMYLCDFMMQFPFENWVGTIVHEASHHFGTDDHIYGRQEGKDLARRDARKAYNNADNVEYWVTDMVSELGTEAASRPAEEEEPEPTRPNTIVRSGGCTQKNKRHFDCGQCRGTEVQVITSSGQRHMGTIDGSKYRFRSTPRRGSGADKACNGGRCGVYLCYIRLRGWNKSYTFDDVKVLG